MIPAAAADRDPSPIPLDGADGDALLALNNAFARELSFHTAESWGRLVRAAWRARRIGRADAFLVAFDQDGDYQSPNFLWFKARHERFVYVDRVATAPEMRGRGLARRLYADLFLAAQAAGHDMVCCEVNREPPNPGSDSFHAALGFAEVGLGRPDGGEKTVRYLARTL